ncbi:MAG: hypothetical protein VX834_07360 [Myxococcota bacterium]|nr:hypothetical protein [Myxococcota bacterium]
MNPLILASTSFFFACLISLSADAQTCIAFNDAQRVGEFSDSQISESSGLAVSSQHADLLWTHNDSGDLARIYAFSESGESRGTINLSGASANDWEAMAIGPCSSGSCLVIGDVGDNNRNRDAVSLWRLAEPTPTGAGTEQIVQSSELRAIYPDGAQDCEAIAIDPLSGDIILIEKSLSAKARTYRVPSETWESNADADFTLLPLTTIDFETDSLTGGLVTGADISPSGFELFARTYIAGFHLPVVRDEAGTITGFGTPRQVSVYDDGQCEAVAYDDTGLELWFTCEDENGPIARATCKTTRDDETGVTTTQEGGCRATALPWPLMLLGLAVRLRRHA